MTLAHYRRPLKIVASLLCLLLSMLLGLGQPCLWAAVVQPEKPADCCGHCHAPGAPAATAQDHDSRTGDASHGQDAACCQQIQMTSAPRSDWSAATLSDLPFRPVPDWLAELLSSLDAAPPVPVILGDHPPDRVATQVALRRCQPSLAPPSAL